MTNFTPNTGLPEEEEYELVTAEDWTEEAKRRYKKAGEYYSDHTVHYMAAQAAALIAVALKDSRS